MTTLNQRRAVPVELPRHALAPQRTIDAILRLATRLRTGLLAAMDRGQLGSDAETEIGRWTGARV